jgi:hypothetical protein
MANFYIANLGTSISTDMKTKCQTLLQSYFSRIAAHARPKGKVKFATLNVSWVESNPNPTDTDILVYLVTDKMHSVVNRFAGTTISAASDGITYNLTSGGVKSSASEVYFDSSKRDFAFLTNLLFHEALHNKCFVGDSMHGASGSMSSGTLTAGSVLTNTDIELMGNNLGNPISQWSSGFNYKPNPNDPLDGLGL